MARRNDSHWAWELFLEYLIAGLATALGEALMVRLFKAFRRKRRKCKHRKGAADEVEVADEEE